MGHKKDTGLFRIQHLARMTLTFQFLSMNLDLDLLHHGNHIILNQLFITMQQMTGVTVATVNVPKDSVSRLQDML